jgi:hypothetical protein
MTAHQTVRSGHLSERQKAGARLVLLTVVGLACPPLAAARSVLIWVVYLVVAVLYSLWAVTVTRSPSGDRVLGYLLCLTDGVVLLPIVVWSTGAAMRIVLVFLWAVGLTASWRIDRSLESGSRSRTATRRASRSAKTRAPSVSVWEYGTEAPLERALRVRLRVLEVTKTRFAIVLLRVAGYAETVAYYGEEAARRMVDTVSRQGLRLLGADAQLFLLPGGRMAFVFATDTGEDGRSSRSRVSGSAIDPYDVESLAMALGRRACEQTIDGHRFECVVGWASAPADGVTADDLMYAAESGALSTAAFRRVGGSRIPVPEPEKKRAVAG